MQIQIAQLDETDIGLLVLFTTQVGVGKGIWTGTKPQLHATYSIELEVREILLWGKTVYEIQENTPKLSFTENTLSIDGVLDHIYEDGVIIAALGTSLIMAATEGVPPHLNQPIRINCSLPFIYDTHQ